MALPTCRALAEVFADEGLLGESEVVLANERGPTTATFLRDGLDTLSRTQKRAVLRLCVAAWEAGTADADRRVTACLVELGVTGCVACALGALSDDGPCDVHSDDQGGA